MNGGLINRMRNSKVANHYWALITIEGLMISQIVLTDDNSERTISRILSLAISKHIPNEYQLVVLGSRWTLINMPDRSGTRMINTSLYDKISLLKLVRN